MIPEIEELYQEVILDHSRRPRNFGELPDAAVRVHGDNPACGDEIHLAVKFDASGGLEDIKFSGRGCAIFRSGSTVGCFRGGPRKRRLSRERANQRFQLSRRNYCGGSRAAAELGIAGDSPAATKEICFTWWSNTSKTRP